MATTSATRPDSEATAGINDRLADHGMLPREPLVDTTDVTADQLVASRDDHGMDLIGPAPGDQRWQARQQIGYKVTRFAIDWEARQATCPRGATSVIWSHRVIAAALHLVRVAAWLTGVPRSMTRRSAFAALAPTAP